MTQQTINSLNHDGAWATFNHARTHRFTLGRRIDGGGNRRIVWCMLNPSTADEFVLDPTVRRCVGFSQRWGYGVVVVVNLFALRSTDPAGLLAHAEPIGDGNDAAIVDEARRADCVVAAWGAFPLARARGRQVLGLINREVGCLGITETRQPRHPLYVRGDQPLIPYRVDPP